MFRRRVTRNSAQAHVATTNNVPATPAVANNVTLVDVADVTQPIKTRSGRILGHIATTAQKLAGGRRGRKTPGQNVVTAEASTNNAIAHTTDHLPPVASVVASAPPRKRARKDATAASASSKAPAEATNDVPAAAGPRKRAATTKQASTRSRSAKGKAKAVAPPPPAAIPAFPPKSEEEIDEICQSLDTMLQTSLSKEQLKFRSTEPYRPLFGLPGYECLGPVFNFFQPAFRAVMGVPQARPGVQEQPAIPGRDEGYDTESDEDSEDLDGTESSQFESSQEGETEPPRQQNGPIYAPIVFPSPLPEPVDPETVAPRNEPRRGGLLTRQNAINLGQPEAGPSAASSSNSQDQGDALPGLSFRDMVDAEDRTSPVPVGLGTELPPVHEIQPSAEVIERLKPYNVQPLRRQSYFFLEAQSRAQEARNTDEYIEPPPLASSSALMIKDAPKRRGIPLRRGATMPPPPEYLRPFDELVSSGPQPEPTQSRPAPVRGTPLRRGAKMPPPPEYLVTIDRAASSQPSGSNAEFIAGPSSQTILAPPSGPASKKYGAPLRRGAGIPPPPEYFVQFDRSESSQAASVSDAPPVVPSTSTPTAPRPHTRGVPLTRQYAVFIDKNFREVPTGRTDVPLDSADDGLAGPMADTPQPAPSSSEVTLSVPPSPQAQPAASSTMDKSGKRAATLRALSKTPSQTSLRSLTAARKGTPLSFSRTGSQSSMGAGASEPTPSQSVPAGKSKERAVSLDTVAQAATPSPSPSPSPNSPSGGDKGKKRSRSEDSDDLDEVEASLIIDKDELPLAGHAEAEPQDADAEMDMEGAALAAAVEQLFPPGWPKNYVRQQGLFRIEVSTVPMTHLPIAPLPKRSRSASSSTSRSSVSVSRPGKRTRNEAGMEDVPADVTPQTKKSRVEPEVEAQ